MPCPAHGRHSARSPREASVHLSRDGDCWSQGPSMGQIPNTHLLIWFSQPPVSRVHLPRLQMTLRPKEPLPKSLLVHSGQHGGPSPGLPDSKALVLSTTLFRGKIWVETEWQWENNSAGCWKKCFGERPPHTVISWWVKKMFQFLFWTSQGLTY